MRAVTSSWTTTASLLLAVLVRHFFFFLICLSCLLFSHLIKSWHTSNVLQWLSFLLLSCRVRRVVSKKKKSVSKSPIPQMSRSEAHLEVCPIIVISPTILLPTLVTSSSRLGSRCTRCRRGRRSSPVAGRRSSSRRRRVRVRPRDAHSSSLITATIVAAVSKPVVVAAVTVAVIRSR